MPVGSFLALPSRYSFKNIKNNHLHADGGSLILSSIFISICSPSLGSSFYTYYIHVYFARISFFLDILRESVISRCESPFTALSHRRGSKSFSNRRSSSSLIKSESPLWILVWNRSAASCNGIFFHHQSSFQNFFHGFSHLLFSRAVCSTSLSIFVLCPRQAILPFPICSLKPQTRPFELAAHRCILRGCSQSPSSFDPVKDNRRTHRHPIIIGSFILFSWISRTLNITFFIHPDRSLAPDELSCISRLTFASTSHQPSQLRHHVTLMILNQKLRSLP